MLPAENRLREGSDFRHAFRRGVSAGSRHLVLHCAPEESHATRVGFVVSKAVGNAVVRNRVKRRLREAVRARLGGLPAGLLVVRAKPAAASAEYADLCRSLDRCLERLPVSEESR